MARDLDGRAHGHPAFCFPTWQFGRAWKQQTSPKGVTLWEPLRERFLRDAVSRAESREQFSKSSCPRCVETGQFQRLRVANAGRESPLRDRLPVRVPLDELSLAFTFLDELTTRRREVESTLRKVVRKRIAQMRKFLSLPTLGGFYEARPPPKRY